MCFVPNLMMLNIKEYRSLKAVRYFVDKNCAIFLFFAQNTDRGYTLGPY